MPNVSAARWMQVLHASTDYSFNVADAVTFADKTFLDAVNNIFSRHNNTAMKRDLSWTFVQVFSSIADRDFLMHTLGTRSLALEQRRSFCVTEIEAAYRWLIVSLHVLTDFPPDRRAVIDASLNGVTQTVVSKLDNLSWADTDLRRALSDKVLNVSVTMWPTGSLLTTEGISHFYAGWFSNTSSFTQHWVTAARNWRRLNIPAYLSEHPRMQQFIEYDYFLNAIQIALVTLQPPWHYANGTKAMTYGTLVFFYALQLVRSFDAIGLQIDPEGRVSDSWLPAGTKAVTDKRASCLGSGRDYDDYFPEVPAIEAAHATFEATLTEHERSQVVVSGCSEDQLFFLAACFILCGLHDEQEMARRVSCNKAVANFQPFAKAFGCRDNAAMNPPNKCPFFD
ncbi:hypothetical protein V5799_032522 [Amblyomma americanum]|uniref:Uncharacterized protein n=1 Tax=Amblyomma americanum TaxID=6943 RepID=A0AAQ4DQX8_AMBAM